MRGVEENKLKRSLLEFDALEPDTGEVASGNLNPGRGEIREADPADVVVDQAFSVAQRVDYRFFVFKDVFAMAGAYAAAGQSRTAASVYGAGAGDEHILSRRVHSKPRHSQAFSGTIVDHMQIVYHDAMHACHFCGAAVQNPREVFRGTSCPGCGKDLKICLNCRFYSPGAHWDCSETIDEMVADKDRANFCTYFVFRDSQPGAAKPSGDNAARKKLDQLFGNG